MRKKVFCLQTVRTALALACALTMLTASSFAAEFYGIVESFGEKARNAYVDVSVDTVISTAIDVQINASAPDGSLLADFTVRANGQGLASTAAWGNLFNLTGGQPMLVRVRTPDAAGSAAVLYVDSQGAPFTIELLPARRADLSPLGIGTTFFIALGNFRSASLLIANVSGADQAVDVFKGTPGAPGNGIYTNPRISNNAQWRVNLTQNEANSGIVVTATGPVIVQAVIDDARSIQSFIVLPRQ